MGEIDIYGDEDGNYFASGHWTADEMIAAAVAWETEVADPISPDDISRGSHRQYHVIDDPRNDERYVIVSRDHPGASPMTSIFGDA